MQVNTTGIRRFTDPDNKAKGDFHGHGQNFLGIALIAFSIAMVINPANAAGCDTSCSVGNGNVLIPDGVSADGSPQVTDQAIYTAALVICQPSLKMLP